MQKGDSYGGAGLTFPPESGRHTSTVIWLHGLGDTAHGWAPVVPELRARHTKFILPTADTRPITLNMGMPMPGWSDIYSLSESAREDEAGLLQSVRRVQAIVEGEAERGIAPGRIVLAGFSQGGAVALQAYLRSERQLGAFLGLSTWLALRDKALDAVPSTRQRGRICLWHGDADEIVEHRWGAHSAEVLRQRLPDGFTVDFHTVRGLPHSANEAEIDAVRRELQTILGND